MVFGCDVNPDDTVTIAAEVYDDEMIYLTAAESNEAGVMTHHIGFFLTPEQAIEMGGRLIDEGKRKSKKRRGGVFSFG